MTTEFGGQGKVEEGNVTWTERSTGTPKSREVNVHPWWVIGLVAAALGILKWLKLL